MWALKRRESGMLGLRTGCDAISLLLAIRSRLRPDLDQDVDHNPDRPAEPERPQRPWRPYSFERPRRRL